MFGKHTYTISNIQVALFISSKVEASYPVDEDFNDLKESKFYRFIIIPILCYYLQAFIYIAMFVCMYNIIMYVTSVDQKSCKLY